MFFFFVLCSPGRPKIVHRKKYRSKGKFPGGLVYRVADQDYSDTHELASEAVTQLSADILVRNEFVGLVVVGKGDACSSCHTKKRSCCRPLLRNREDGRMFVFTVAPCFGCKRKCIVCVSPYPPLPCAWLCVYIFDLPPPSSTPFVFVCVRVLSLSLCVCLPFSSVSWYLVWWRRSTFSPISSYYALSSTGGTRSHL